MLERSSSSTTSHPEAATQSRMAEPGPKRTLPPEKTTAVSLLFLLLFLHIFLLLLLFLHLFLLFLHFVLLFFFIFFFFFFFFFWTSP